MVRRLILTGVALGFLAMTALFWRDLAAAPGTPVGDDDVRLAYLRYIETLVGPDEPIWVGPIDPGAYLDSHRQPGSRYVFYLPWQASAGSISSGLVADLERTRPPVVVFWPPEASLNGKYRLRDYAGGLYGYLNEHYETLGAHHFLWRMVWLRSDRAVELRSTLQHMGLYAPEADIAG